MVVRPVKTDRIEPGAIDLARFLDKYLERPGKGSIIAVASKIVSLCEGRVVPINKADKNQLAIKEADFYLPRHMSKYGYSFTITHNTLIPVAGIDESNGNDNYVLWPSDPQASANFIRQHLIKRSGLKNIGVIITDSTARPLHYGTEGVAIAFSGFAPLNNYVGKKDLFGRDFKVSVANVADALASAAVAVMGEGAEQTPVAVISDIGFVKFKDREPTAEELDAFFVKHMEDDLFEPFLRNMDWREGGRGTS